MILFHLGTYLRISVIYSVYRRIVSIAVIDKASLKINDVYISRMSYVVINVVTDVAINVSRNVVGMVKNFRVSCLHILTDLRSI